MSTPVTKTTYRLNGVEHDDVEHIVTDENPDRSLCGVDQTDVPWNQGYPPCQACVEVMSGRMN